MLTIRLQRAGKRNRPEFRIVLAQKESSASKKFLEILGNYNPRTKEFAVKDEARLQYWIAQHVQISPTVHNLLVGKNLLTSGKVQAFKIPKKAAEPVQTEQTITASEDTNTSVPDQQSPETAPIAEVSNEAVQEQEPQPEAAPPE